MERPSPLLRALPVALVVGLALAAYAHRDAWDAQAFLALVASWGAFAGVGFVLIHACVSLVGFPRWAMAIVAGALFGAWGGIPWALAGAVAGGSSVFALARFANSGAVVPHDLPRVGPWIARAEAGGWRTVAILRLLPLPGIAVNIGLGVSAIAYRQFALGTAAGSLPHSIVFTKLGAAGVLVAQDGLAEARLPLAIAAVAGLAAVALSFLVRKRARA
ncbi:MAG: VTT domain-containing protein [Tagaea sp.]|nr:VTT domain-containing protein [Tagaea sp.]